SYSCLLGRPWIHSSGEIPSSLHQKSKLVISNHLVTISGEEELLVTKPSNTPYIEVVEEALECLFRSFEIDIAINMAKGSSILKPQLSNATKMAGKIMMKGEHQPRKGIGAKQ
ncbi:hypothetical protein CFOL_v3_07265, partial [Cephalotus follicularis]